MRVLKLKCVKPKIGLTFGKVYDLVNVSAEYVVIKDDNGGYATWFEGLFEIVKY